MASENTAEDDRTLRLSTQDLLPQDVDGLLAYQRALRDELEFSPVCHAGWTEMLSSAHQRSLALSGMDPGRLARITSVAQDFCARRVGARAIRRRLEEVRERLAAAGARGGAGSADDEELAKTLAVEVARLDDLSALERRHGQANIAVLKAREDEVVTLHEELSPLLSKG